MRKLATVLALSLAATHGLPTPRGSAIAKKDEAKDDAPRFLRGGISKDGDEAVNPGRKPLMGSMVPPVPPFVGIVTPPRGTLPISKSCKVPDVEYSNPSIREELNTIQMPGCANAIEFWGTIPANDENGLRVQAITVRIVTLNFGWSCPPAKKCYSDYYPDQEPGTCYTNGELGGKRCYARPDHVKYVPGDGHRHTRVPCH